MLRGCVSLFISSDTNIWIDFFEINHLDHPFLIEHQYYLSSAAFEDELIQSAELREALLQNGLCLTELTDEEFDLAQGFRSTYRRLSSYDAFALAIAKARSWTLLTGDNPLRRAAEREGVECHGIIWIYDELLDQRRIAVEDYCEAMQLLLTAVQENRCRLPVEELVKRLKRK